MVKYYTDTLDTTFFALSDATRRGILARLAIGGATVTQLAEPFEMSLPAISKHLRYLEKANLVKREKKGRVIHLELNPEPLAQANQWVEQYRQMWADNLNSLDRYLKESKTKGDTSP